MLHSDKVYSDLGLETGTGFDFGFANLVPYMEPGRETLGFDPRRPTSAKPGSVEKVTTLAARYAAGLPLWHTADCSDQGASGRVQTDD